MMGIVCEAERRRELDAGEWRWDKSDIEKQRFRMHILYISGRDGDVTSVVMANIGNMMIREVAAR